MSARPARQVDSPYLTTLEAVQYLRCGSKQALYRLITEHGLPHGRRGRLHLFDTRDLDAWVRDSSMRAPSVPATRHLRAAR